MQDEGRTIRGEGAGDRKLHPEHEVFILHPSSFPHAKESLVPGARIRLASLWVSQVARVLADWCLRVLAFLECAGPGLRNRGTAWHLATAVFIAPFILLAPLTGCLSNGLSRRLVLGGSA